MFKSNAGVVDLRNIFLCKKFKFNVKTNITFLRI